MAGLTDYGEAQALGALLPSGTNRWVLLYTTMPADDGTGGVEAAGSGYARVAHSAWVDAIVGDYTYRRNSGAITFAALTGALSGIVGWGISDAAVAGNIVGTGLIRDAGGTAVTKNFIAGDQPRFIDQELKLGLR